jgi:hypothetical protein
MQYLNKHFKISVWIFFACNLIACGDETSFERKNLFRTGEMISIEYNQAQIQGEIVDLKSGEILLQHGHCWATTPLPSLNDNYTELGETSTPSSFVSSLVSLNAQQTYYVRAYFVIENDTLFGEEISFQTSINPNLPQVSNVSIFNISTDEATVRSRFDSFGNINIIQHGHCWSATNSLPDLDGANTNLGTNTNPSGEFFESTLLTLSPDTEYYVRAYTLTNDNGNIETVYSQATRFKTAKE